jgi:hypothetical protein
MKCSICHKEIPAVGTWTTGNNAQPVNDGRCCDDCNVSVVLPARLKELWVRQSAKAARPSTPSGDQDSPSVPS